MTSIPKKCRAAVFRTPGQPLEIEEFALPDELDDNAILCKTRLSTICGSDIHTISGKRKEPVPLVLGHEMVGNIVKLGKNITMDGFGNRLSTGDRVSWTIMASCGECRYCRMDMPQKCLKLKKYGHTLFTEKNESALLGGYGEYIYVLPGTAVFRVPDKISDAVASPANCGVATVINAVETIGIYKGDIVLVLGAGLLGLNLCALLKETGASEIIAADVVDSRLAMATRFGATRTINIRGLSRNDFSAFIGEVTGGKGLDAAIEVCGIPETVAYAVDNFRIGGRFMTVGMVSAGSNFSIDGNDITRKYLTIKGVHNYKPEHLKKALLFLEKNQDKYPYNEVVSAEYSLDEINRAVEEAKTGKHIRVGIRFS